MGKIINNNIITCMVIGSEHFVMYTNVKLLYRTREINIILYTNDTSIKNRTTATKPPHTYGYKERMTMQMW